MLPESTTALQDSNLAPAEISTGLACASIYGNTDLKHLSCANLGTNRLVLGKPNSRTQRELSSSVVRAKGPSRDNLFETNTIGCDR